jgi:hypothetical protein
VETTRVKRYRGQPKEADGQKELTFYDGNVPYNLGFGSCDIRPGKCIALYLIVLVDPGSAGPSLEGINAVNKEGLFVTLVKLDGNRFGAGHVMVVDGGVTKKNMAINIASFVVTFADTMRRLASQPGQVIASVRPGSALMGAPRYVPPHAVRATPREIAEVLKTITIRHQTSLRPLR